MTEPLALILYEKLLPGSQLVNRLQDLKFRVQTLSDPSELVARAEFVKPMLVIVDLESQKSDVGAAVTQLRKNPNTSHLPVIGFSGSEEKETAASAQTAGVTLFVSETAILSYLPQLLEQALAVE